MRKFAKSLLITVGVIVAVPVLAVATTAIGNAIATQVESSQITDYGQGVEVDGKTMNVVVSGDGAETIVLLPGLGTASPGRDFQPLTDELSHDYRVVVVEPFGTGLSDATDSPRTAENITGEIHEALQQLGVTKFTLMAHSIGGIYALTYSAAYPDELTAFIGIDNSVPDQPGAGEPIPTDAMVVLRNLGITRLLTAIAGDPYEGLPYDDESRRQMALLSAKNAGAPTMIDEVENTPGNFASVSGAVFPADLPVLTFVSANDTAEWIEIHEQQAASVEHGEIVVLDGPHYLHHELSAEIAERTAAFLVALSR
ncbi:alpha/beta fold hydrolase [Microbacterium sp. LWO12-1.2]|uniref:alpha/beta fold hydrolase n=1 Tax=Microbacterium sp. LWO12-1.2 TaxID=3135261 RepID=UPI0034174006